MGNVKRVSADTLEINGIEFNSVIAKNVLVALWNNKAVKLETGTSIEVPTDELIKMMGGK